MWIGVRRSKIANHFKLNRENGVHQIGKCGVKKGVFLKNNQIGRQQKRTSCVWVQRCIAVPNAFGVTRDTLVLFLCFLDLLGGCWFHFFPTSLWRVTCLYACFTHVFLQKICF